MPKQAQNILFGVWCFLLLFPILVEAKSENVSMSPSKSQPGFVLSVHEDLISLKAEDAPLKAILEAIGKKMNVEILGDTQEGETISAEFNQLPLTEALERLSPNYGYQMGMEKGEQKISKIFVLPKPKGFVRPKPAVQAPQIVEPAVSSDLAINEHPDEHASRKTDDEPDEEKPARPDPFKFEFDPSSLMPKSQ